MIELGGQDEACDGEAFARLRSLVASGRFVGGPEIEALEREIAMRLGVPCAIGVANGTDAIHLALRAAGVGPGDEVITTPFTFVATASAICHAGARPVFADIDPVSFNLSPESVERALTSRTRALLPVHLFGQPAEMPALMALAERHDLLVIEDCAQSFGASLHGTPTGAFGAAGTFSFYPTKNLGAWGDGGLVVTRNDELGRRVRQLANHGVGAPLEYVDIGFNSRLDALQAAVLRVKLRHIDDWNRARQRIAARYDALLAGLPLQTPVTLPGCVHVYHHYTVLVERRDEVAVALREAGVATAVHYARPLHRQPVFSGMLPPVDLPVAEDVSRRCLSLPIYPELRDAQVETVAAALRHALGD